MQYPILGSVCWTTLALLVILGGSPLTCISASAFSWDPIGDIKNPGRILDNTRNTVEKGAQDLGKTAEKAAQDVGKTVEKAAQDGGKTAEKVAQDAGKTVEKAGQDIGKAIEKAGQDGGQVVEKAAQDAGKTIEKAAQDAGKTIEKAGQDAGKTIEKAARDGGKTTEQAVQDASKTIEKAAQDAGKTIEKAGQDAGKTIEKALQDTGKTLEKAAQDTVQEADRGVKNVEEAGRAIGKFVERQAQGLGESLSTAEKRVREGKVVDALWHLGTDQFRYTEESAAKAAQESSLINTIGQVAASAYGGPGGAAAYAAWYTYKQTGDADLALRVGLITGATSAGFSAVGTMPANTDGELAKKVLLGGAIGGLAVAASGGDEAAIKEGFWRSGGMILVQDGYKRVTKHELDARSSKGEAYCMLTLDMNSQCAPPKEAYVRDGNGNIRLDSEGKPMVDVRNTDPTRPHVGHMSTESQATWSHERGQFMTSVSRIPGMNAMSVFHDHWSVSWDMNSLINVGSIAPAIVLTYAGTGAPVYDLIQRTSVANSPDKRERELKQSSDSGLAQMTIGEQLSASSIEDFSASFVCIGKTRTRRIVVESPRDNNDYICRVIYSNEKATSVPWYAKHQKDFCLSKAAYLVSRHVSGGWSCFGQ